VLRCPEADAIAVAEEVELFDLRVFAVRETDVDKADGFAGVGAFTGARAGGPSPSMVEPSPSGAAAAALDRSA